MDQQVRELERQAATGDPEAQQKLGVLRLRAGLSPNWRYLLAEFMRVQELQKTHLFKAIDSEFKEYFEKHLNSGVEGFYWGIYDRPDCGNWEYTPNNWDIEGLGIVIGDEYWDEHCQITDYGLEFSAATLISHLKDVCDCLHPMVMRADGTVIKDNPCYIGNFPQLEDEQKQALCAALEDAIKIFELLKQTQRDLVYPKGLSFTYQPKTGLVAKETK
jgi:hypothetical protein